MIVGASCFTSDGTRSNGKYYGGMLVRIAYDEDVAGGAVPSSSSSGACCGKASSDGIRTRLRWVKGFLAVVVMLAGVGTVAA